MELTLGRHLERRPRTRRGACAVSRRRYDPFLDAGAALCGAAAGVVIVHAGVFVVCWLLFRKAVRR